MPVGLGDLGKQRVQAERWMLPGGIIFGLRDDNHINLRLGQTLGHIAS